MRRLLAAAALALSAPVDAAVQPDPETILCPPTPGDLDYALFAVMTAAKFQEWPAGSGMSWRRRVDGPFHVLSLEPASYLRVEYRTFVTAAGTRVVADMHWQTSSYEFGVEQEQPVRAIQVTLDALAQVYPC